MNDSNILKKEESVRCNRCGQNVWSLDTSPLRTAHGNSLLNSTNECSSENWRQGQVFWCGEGDIPTWVSTALETGLWRSGTLRCSCTSPIGTFDFVSGRKCACGQVLLPPLRLSAKKIDIPLPINLKSKPVSQIEK